MRLSSIEKGMADALSTIVLQQNRFTAIQYLVRVIAGLYQWLTERFSVISKSAGGCGAYQPITIVSTDDDRLPMAIVR